jgi:Outer membrane protein beta-barrel domain
MKSILKKVTLFSALSALAIAPVFAAGAASAQTATGLTGSYLGAGVSVGVTDGGNDDDDSDIGGTVQGRYDLPNAPVSLRGAALINGDGAALMPLVTVDIPVTNSANLYAGGGYSFVTGDSGSTPLGDQNAPVLTAGLEAAVARRVALFGDVKLGLDAYENSSDAAVSVQVGAGYRF